MRRPSAAALGQDRLVGRGPYGAGPDPVAESAQFPVDAAVAAGRILPGQPQHQPAQLGRQGRPSTAARVGPWAPNQARCHCSSVLGCTNSPRQSDRGSIRASPASTARSAQSIRGWVTCRRSTATSCRSASSSALLVAERRASSPSHGGTSAAPKRARGAMDSAGSGRQAQGWRVGLPCWRHPGGGH
jgi:hypothetical protein